MQTGNCAETRERDREREERALRLRGDAEDLLEALEALHEWLKDGPPSQDTPAGDIVRDGLYRQQEDHARVLRHPR
jgi:hypothetical protein